MFGDKTSSIRYITLAIIATHVYYAMSKVSEVDGENNEVKKDANDTFVSNSKDKIPNLISRKDWGATRPRLFSNIQKLQHPVPFVLISYFKPAITDDKMALQAIQHKHMKAGLSDIQSNFLIGRDGKIYEGRGWDDQPARSIELPAYNGKFIEISYIGDFNHEDCKHPVYRATWEVMEFGREHGYIDENFQMLSEKNKFDKEI